MTVVTKPTPSTTEATSCLALVGSHQRAGGAGLPRALGARLDRIQRLGTILSQLEGDRGNAVAVNKEADKLSAEIGRRFEQMMYPGGVTEGEDDGLAARRQRRRRA